MAALTCPAFVFMLLAINELNEAALPTLRKSGLLRNDLSLALNRLRRRCAINDGRRLLDSIQGRFTAVPFIRSVQPSDWN